MNKINGNRVYMLDLIRIVCALAIFGRHAITLGGFSFGRYFNELFLNSTTIIMTCFFMLSGFSLYLSNGQKNLFEGKSIFEFYKKRIISIIPMYYFVHIAYLIFFDTETPRSLIYLPAELLGIQTNFSTIFEILPNGATWFVSCMIINYFFYPLLQEILNKLKLNLRIIILIFLIFLSIYIPIYVTFSNSMSIYTNPFVRLIEFNLGIVVASILNNQHKEKIKKNNLKSWAIIIGCVCFLLVAIYKNIEILKCSYIILISIVLYYSVDFKCDFLERCRPLIYISGLTYAFYILQIFIWNPSNYVISLFGLATWKYNFIIAIAILSVACIVLHEFYEKPLQRLLRGKILRNKKQNS